MQDELTIRRLVILGENGARMVVDASGISIAGGPGRGRIEASFGSDGEPAFALYSEDGTARVGMRASNDGTGIISVTAEKQSGLTSAGLFVDGPDQRITLSEQGLIVNNANGEKTSIPFSLPDFRGFLGGLVAKVKAMLSAA